jgi:uncharacterized membrane protein YheB (UPF0754 family)
MDEFQLLAFVIMPIVVGIIGCLAAWLGIKYIP